MVKNFVYHTNQNLNEKLEQSSVAVVSDYNPKHEVVIYSKSSFFLKAAFNHFLFIPL